MLKQLTAVACSICAYAAISSMPAYAADAKMVLATTEPVTEYGFSYTPYEVFAREVEARSGGSFKVDFFPGGQLGGVESTVNQVLDGVIQGSSAADGALSSVFPEIQILSVPYAFVNREVAWEVLDGPFGRKLADMMAKKTGLRPLAWFGNGGYRNFTSANKELKTVDDLVGLKMRTMAHPLHMQIAKSLGMSPTPIPWGELYTSLQTSVVDGQENSIPVFMVPKLQEVQKFMILDGHVYSTQTIVVNEDWYQGLTDEQRTIVSQATELARETSRGLSIANEIVGRTKLGQEGVTIHAISAEEKARFREKTQGPAVEWLKAQIGDELVDEFLAAVKDAEAKTGN